MTNSKITGKQYIRYAIASALQCGSNGTNFDPLAWLEVEKIAKNCKKIQNFSDKKQIRLFEMVPEGAILNNRLRNQTQTTSLGVGSTEQ